MITTSGAVLTTPPMPAFLETPSSVTQKPSLYGNAKLYNLDCGMLEGMRNDAGFEERSGKVGCKRGKKLR